MGFIGPFRTPYIALKFEIGAVDELLLLPPTMEKASSACRRLRLLFSHKPPPKAVIRKENPNISSEPKTVVPTTKPPGNFEKIVERFKKKSDSSGFRAHRKAYVVTVRRLACARQFSHVDEILQHQKQYPAIKDELFTARLITLYGQAKMLDHALHLFDEMPQLNCPRTAVSFNALLAACFRAGNPDKLMELFRELPAKLSIQPDAISYTTAVKALCRKGSFDDAVSIIEEMAANGVAPDAVTFHALLCHLYRGRVSEAENVWELMKAKKVDPDLRCYNYRLHGMMSEKRICEAMEIVKEMEEKGMKPITYTYNLFIRAYAEEGDVEGVKKWYAALEESDAGADVSTYSSMIPFALEKIGVDFAVELCKKAGGLERKLHKDVVMRVSDELIKCSRVEEAKELLQLFNFPPNKAD